MCKGEVVMSRKRIIQLAVAVAVLTLVLKYSDWFLNAVSLIAGVIRPLLIGCVLAYILNILMSRIERLPLFRQETAPLYKVRRPISILGSLIIIIALITLVIMIVIPQLFQAVSVLAKEIPSAISDLIKWLSSSDRDWPRLQQLLESLNVDWAQLFQKTVSNLTSSLSTLFSSTVSVLGSIGSMVVTFVVALIFAIYLLAGREKLFAQFQTLAKTYLKETWYRRTALVLSTAHDTFSRFIVGQYTEAVILGALCTAGMFLFRFPYAAMVGSSVGLPGIWVLCAVTIGGGLSGIIGMLFAVPLTATVYKLIRQDVRKRQAKPAQERIGGK